MIAVIADIHRNVWALQLSSEDLDRLGPSRGSLWRGTWLGSVHNLAGVWGTHRLVSYNLTEALEASARRGNPLLRRLVHCLERSAEMA